MRPLAKTDIDRLLRRLDEELRASGVVGEIQLVGGAVLCLVYEARAATLDVDAYFRPAVEIRRAAKRIAEEEGLPEHWLNDAVKGYLSSSGTFTPYLELAHLKVQTATPEYLLAMKCLAMRIGEEFHDEDDVRYLLRYLGIETYERAIAVVTAYYPLELFPQKTLYALAEILCD